MSFASFKTYLTHFKEQSVIGVRRFFDSSRNNQRALTYKDNDKEVFHKIQVSNEKKKNSLKAEVEAYVVGLTPSERKTLNYLLGIANSNRSIHPSQTGAIKDYVGVHRVTANRATRKLERDGLLLGKQRWNTSKVYQVNELFFIPEIRATLSNLLTSLKYIPFVWLMSSPNINPCLSEYATLNNIKRDIYNPCREADKDREIKKRKSFDYTWCMKKGKRVLMRQFRQGSGIPVYIQQLTVLALTDAGRRKLSVFPAEAIQYAVGKMKHFKHIKEPFNWFFVTCKQWCDDNNVRPDWEFAKDIGRDEVMLKHAYRPHPAEKTNRNHSPLEEKPELSVDEQIAQFKKDLINYKRMLIDPPESSRLFRDSLTKIWYQKIEQIQKDLQELMEIHKQCEELKE